MWDNRGKFWTDNQTNQPKFELYKPNVVHLYTAENPLLYILAKIGNLGMT